MSDRPETPLLDQVQYPADIRKLDKAQLPQLADELRAGDDLGRVAIGRASRARALAWSS